MRYEQRIRQRVTLRLEARELGGGRVDARRRHVCRARRVEIRTGCVDVGSRRVRRSRRGLALARRHALVHAAQSEARLLVPRLDIAQFVALPLPLVFQRSLTLVRLGTRARGRRVGVAQRLAQLRCGVGDRRAQVRQR